MRVCSQDHSRKFPSLTRYRPILTYGRQGCTKPGVKPEDHTIIYTGDNPPDLLPDEVLDKVPIQMIGDQGETLRPESRVNYSKIYTVEHNVKVCFIGSIAPASEKNFFTDFRRTFDE